MGNLTNIPFVTGSDFGSDVWILQQFHFHWAKDVYSGSEHLINGQTYPLEVTLFMQVIDHFLIIFDFLP